MIYGILITIHIIASLVLILVILLQAGRGGGLADSFGGSQAQSIFGTKTATVLTRATSVLAIAFLCTSILLAVVSGHRSRSLMYETKELPKDAKEAPKPAK